MCGLRSATTAPLSTSTTCRLASGAARHGTVHERVDAARRASLPDGGVGRTRPARLCARATFPRRRFAASAMGVSRIKRRALSPPTACVEPSSMRGILSNGGFAALSVVGCRLLHSTCLAQTLTTDNRQPRRKPSQLQPLIRLRQRQPDPIAQHRRTAAADLIMDLAARIAPAEVRQHDRFVFETIRRTRRCRRSGCGGTSPPAPHARR